MLHSSAETYIKELIHTWAVNLLKEESFKLPLGTGPLLLVGNVDGIQRMTSMGRPWRRPYDTEKTTDC